MKYKFNLMAIIAGLIFFVIGLFLALMDAFVWDSPTAIVSNIGCSLLASAVVALITALLVDRRKENPLDEWKISKIYSTRAEKNADSDPELERARYQVDAVAFGLSNFRKMFQSARGAQAARVQPPAYKSGKRYGQADTRITSYAIP